MEIIWGNTGKRLTEIVGEALVDLGSEHVDKTGRAFEYAVDRPEKITSEDRAYEVKLLLSNRLVNKPL